MRKFGALDVISKICFVFFNEFQILTKNTIKYNPEPFSIIWVLQISFWCFPLLFEVVEKGVFQSKTEIYFVWGKNSYSLDPPPFSADSRSQNLRAEPLEPPPLFQKILVSSLGGF